MVDGSHSAATSYQLQTSTNGVTFADSGAPVRIPSATAAGRTPTTSYLARVRSINAAGASAYSNVDTRSTTAVGTTAVARMAAKGWGVNQPGTSYYIGCYPYRNFMRLSVPTWDSNAGAQDANGWITGLPAGGSAVVRILFGTAYVPPGNYVIHTASGAFCTVSDLSGQITNIVQGTNASRDCTFTMPQFPVGDVRYWSITFTVTVTNGTGAPININDLFIGFASNLAGHSFAANATGAQIFDPTFVADLAGCGAMKYADWQMGNSGDRDFSIVPADLAREASRSWSSNNFTSGGIGNCIPHGVVAKLCATVGMAIWPCMPPVHNWYVCAGSVATGVFTNPSPAPWATGQPMVCDIEQAAPLLLRVVYYAIVIDAQHFKVASTHANAIANVPIVLTADSTNSRWWGVYDPGPVYDAIVDEIFAAAPGLDVCPQFVLEPWNSAFFWNQSRYDLGYWSFMLGETPDWDASSTVAWRMTRIWQSFARKFPRSQVIRLIENNGTGFDYSLPNTYDFVDTAGRAGTPGAKLSDLIDVSSSGYYPHFYADSASPNAWAVRDIIAAGGITWTDAQWSQHIRIGISRYRAALKRDRAILDMRTSRHVPMITYETGLTEGMFAQNIDGNNWWGSGFTVDVPGSRILFTNSAEGVQLAGFPVTFTGTATDVPPPPLVRDAQYFCVNPNPTGMQVSTTIGGAPIVFTGPGSGSPHFDSRGQATIDIGKRHYAYTQSAQAGLDMADFLSAFRDVGFIHYTHYTAAAGIGFASTGTGQWAWKNSQFDPDPPLVVAIKGYHFSEPVPAPGGWVDNFMRTWTVSPSGGAFAWSNTGATYWGGTPGAAVISPAGQLGGASFTVESSFTGPDMTLAADVTFINRLNSGTYPQMMLGCLDANNYYGVHFADMSPFIFKVVGGVFSNNFGAHRSLNVDNATYPNCTISLKTNDAGLLDLEFKSNGMIVAYAYNQPIEFARGNGFRLHPDPTLKLANFKVY